MLFTIATILLLMLLVVATKFTRVGRKRRPLAKPLVGRKLGLLERWYASFNPPRYFVQSIKVSGTPIDSSRLETILKILVERLPVLKGAVDGTQKPPVFAKLDMPEKIAFPISFIETPEQEWNNAIIQQVNFKHFPATSAFSASVPLWRLFVLHHPSTPSKFAIVAVFHHLLADGMSGVAFFKHFVAIHKDLVEGRSPSQNPILAPRLEDAIDVRPYLFDLLWEFFSNFGPKKERTYYLGPKEETILDSTNVHILTLRDDGLKALRESCKINGTTLHGALSAALEFACTKVNHPKTFTSEYFHMNQMYPIALRKLVPNLSHPEIMGLIFCGAEDKQVKIRRDTLFWQEAKRINSTIPKLSREGIRLIGMLEYLPGSWEEFVNKTRYRSVPNERIMTLECSNLGQIDFSQENSKNFKVDEFLFLIPNHIAGAVYCCSVATVSNVLNIATTTPAPLLTKEEGEEFQKQVYQIIQAACKSRQFTFSDIYQQ